MAEPEVDLRSVLAGAVPLTRRAVNKVPYVELFNGRLQGVVSSKSDIKRVYVSFIEAETKTYSCSTNNNRPCGGLRGSACKHLTTLVDEALLQFGAERVVSYLGLGLDPAKVNRAWSLMGHLTGGPRRAEASMVFSRFLNYLRYLELAAVPEPLPEMSWFVAG